jgi:hypothetical protein
VLKELTQRTRKEYWKLYERKNQIISKGKHQIIVDISIETLKA